MDRKEGLIEKADNFSDISGKRPVKYPRHSTTNNCNKKEFSGQMSMQAAGERPANNKGSFYDNIPVKILSKSVSSQASNSLKSSS